MQNNVQAVIDRHVAAYLAGDLPGLMADYADNCVFITKATGVIEGKAAIGAAFEMVLQDIFPPATTTMTFEPLLTSGDLALLHWSATTPAFRTVGAFDSFVIRDGKIVSQTGGGEFLPVEEK